MVPTHFSQYRLGTLNSNTFNSNYVVIQSFNSNYVVIQTFYSKRFLVQILKPSFHVIQRHCIGQSLSLFELIGRKPQIKVISYSKF